ncbi:hypothetical protein AX14_004451, partial [Amanita brunnescens Koide BX004]
DFYSMGSLLVRLHSRILPILKELTISTTRSRSEQCFLQAVGRALELWKKPTTDEIQAIPFSLNMFGDISISQGIEYK